MDNDTTNSVASESKKHVREIFVLKASIIQSAVFALWSILHLHLDSAMLSKGNITNYDTN